MKKVLFLIGIFLIVLGVAFLTPKITGLIFPVVGAYFFQGVPATPERMDAKFPGAFGIDSLVPYILAGLGLAFVLGSLLIRQSATSRGSTSGPTLPRFRTWKKRRMLVQFLVLSLIVAHILLYSFGLTTIRTVCPGALGAAAIRGVFGVETVFWGAVLAATLFGGRFLCGWLCVFAPMQETAATILTAIGKKPTKERSLPSWFIYVFTFLFWGSIIFNIILNINNLTFSVANGEDGNITNAGGFVMGLVTLVPLLVFCTYLWGSRFFCRNVCPIGGLSKILTRLGFVKIKIDQGACVDCAACTRQCQMKVDISRYVKAHDTSIRDGNCILCGDCIDSCPKKALKFGIK